MELKKKEYGEYVEKITPKNSLPADMARAPAPPHFAALGYRFRPVRRMLRKISAS